MVVSAPESELLGVDQALDMILGTIPRAATETAPLSACLGRVLARDVHAACNLPAFDNSAMDGYAPDSRDTAGATAQMPVTLRVCGEQPTGIDRKLAAGAGSAVKIMTGAPIPSGADCVVMLEEVGLSQDGIELSREIARGENVRYEGEDIGQGELVLRAGTRLDAAHIGVLAALGVPEPSVHRRPKVAVITTGSELVGVGDTPARGQIRDTNYYTIPAQVAQCGCELSYLRRVADEEQALTQAIREAADVSDVIITSGGVSVGDYDLVKEALASLGRILLWRVAIKPGKPLAYGHVGNCPVFGLPGNPVSSMVAFDVFARPALLRMAGVDEPADNTVSGVLDGDIRHKKGRREYVRAASSWVSGGYRAAPTGDQGSARMSSMLSANSYVVVPETRGSMSCGETVSILLWGCR